MSPIFALTIVLWLACLAQLVYLPIWAVRQGRSGAVWFMLNILWSGGFAALGWYCAVMGAAFSAFGSDGVGAFVSIAPGLLSLLPSLVLAVAGPVRAGMPLNRRRGGRLPLKPGRAWRRAGSGRLRRAAR